MKSTGLGGYLSLINSNSPKTHQNFSFSDTECQNEPSDSSDDETEEAEPEAETSQRFKNKSKTSLLVSMTLLISQKVSFLFFLKSGA